ncbi:LysR family transcriptional regulator [Streptomyces sp. SID13031]|uniref:LysR family transcriptional regulator n=1 Tax=Streptomyces sp. SID13031 TaxID=2706046 RepID=UPI0013C755E2|nr:LysR family transcriptional regulator [Streptomyces sp. SID13031]
MDLDAVRTFVAAATAGKFQDAADDFGITQQAVSKRIAALEKHLGTTLFTRTARGARLTLDGQAFLPNARALLQAEQQALASVKPGNRPLRVDVIGGFLAPAGLVRDFHREHPAVDLDIVNLPDGATAIAAVRARAIDATFRALGGALGDDLGSVRVFDEPLQLLTGPAHPQANAKTLTPSDLRGQRIWMPGNIAGTEWAAYYDELAAAFGFTIDTVGPNFGLDAMLDAMAEAPDRATFVGEQTRFRWPDGYDLRRIDLRHPTPVYPHSLIWRTTNPHPALATLRAHLLRQLHPTTNSVWPGPE